MFDQESPILFSIILPVRNGGEFLKKCIQSILNQSYPHFELKVLENGSTDDTAKWLKTIEDSRVEVISAKEDLNMVQNWKRGMNYINQDYVLFIGHDDFLQPNFLEQHLKYHQKFPDAHVVVSRNNIVNENDEIIRDDYPIPPKVDLPNFLKQYFQQKMDVLGGQTIKTKALFAQGGIDDSYPNFIFGDHKLYLSLLETGEIVSTNGIEFSYRIHSTNLSKQTKTQDYVDAFLKFIDYLIGLKSRHQNTNAVYDEFSPMFFQYHGKSLSHRLLKTSKELRKISVGEFVDQVNEKVQKLNLKNEFNLKNNTSVSFAIILDKIPFLQKKWVVYRSKNPAKKNS